MGSRIRSDESVARGLRRIVDKQIQGALKQLQHHRPSTAVIHQTRKHIKTARAIAHLLKDEVDVHGAERHLRRAAHLLAGLRDAEAMLTTAQSLCRPNKGSLPASSCDALFHVVRHEKVRLQRESRENGVVAHAALALERAARASASWKWGDVEFDRFAAAMRKGYKRSQRAMKDARLQNRASAFHTWRKRIKILWYGVHFLEMSVPSLRRLSLRLKRLDEWLGDAQNLAVLNTKIASLDTNQQSLIRERVLRRQGQLHQKALKSGLVVFNQPPREFTEDWPRLWKRRAR